MLLQCCTVNFPGLKIELSRFENEDSTHGCHPFTSIEPGKNGDGWWKGEDVVRQMAEVTPLFEFKHPGKQMLAIFDNSTNHPVRPDGALGVHAGVNKTPGGKNAPGAPDPKKPGQIIPKMVNGWHMTHV